MKDRSLRFKPGHILAAGAALALMLAACAPAASTSTSIAPVGTLASTEALGATSAPTEALSTEALSTSAATEVSTSAATEASTSAATEMSTSAATEAATSAANSTSEATSAATSAATANPNATAAGTETANQPLLIQSDKLLSMALYDTTGKTLGQITDVLVDITGTVQGVVVNLSATAASTPAATSAASTQAVGTEAVGTQTAVNGVIVPFTDLKADPTNQQLVYQGTATSLASLPAFDASKFSDGYVIRATGTDLPAQYDGLIRLGAQLKDMKLQTATNDTVGSLQNVILDLNSGKATYAAVDISSFVGATNDVVLVPWTIFKLDETDKTSMTPIVRLNVTKSGLQNAPKFDPSTLSFWPTPAMPDWDNQIKLFWQTAGF